MASPTTVARRRRRSLKRRAVVVALVVIVGVGTGVGVAKAQTSSGPSYRTVAAATGNAIRTLTVSGIIEPVNQAQAAFQVSGTVSSVAVAVGQHVNAGQTLATLDTTTLQEQLSQDQALLAAAQAKLDQDESGQTPTGSTNNPVSQSTTTAQTSSRTWTNSTEEAVLTAVTGPAGASNLQQAQQALTNAQHSADVDMQSAGAALATAEATCNSSNNSSPATTGPGTENTSPRGYTGSTTTTSTTTTTPITTSSSSTTSAISTSSTTSTTTPTTTTAPFGGTGRTSTSSACASALDQAMAAQQQVSRDQQAVQRAEQALAQILTTEISSVASNTTRPASTPTNSHSPSPSVTANATNSAAQLASDQATIDSDQASLVSAQQSLDNATLTAPITGTVTNVNLSIGQSVTPGSTANSITITKPGSYQTTSSLTPSQVGQVAVGDAVQVTVNGQNDTMNGTVSRVGPVNTTSSTYSYPLIASINPGSAGTTNIPAGSATQLRVQVATATDTLVLPTSAVHWASAGNSYLTVLQAGRPVRKRVTVGVIGQIYTQLISGLSPGTQVVLANPSLPVPSSSANSTARLGGRFGGAAFPAGFGSGISFGTADGGQ